MPVNQAMTKANLGFCLQYELSTIDFMFSGNVPLMQAGVAGQMSGASAVATVRRGGNQSLRSQDQGRAFRKCMGARIAPCLRIKPE